MPTYTFKHKETGEIVDKHLKLSDYDKYKEDNPEWERHFQSAPDLVSHTGSIVGKTPPSWREHLGNIKKSAGNRAKNSIHD